MKQKNSTPTKEQARVLESHGLRAALCTVVRELQHNMIIKHRISGEFKVIEK